jgi:S-adenosyl-L-methionine hydrolase (adenosine-forming)
MKLIITASPMQRIIVLLTDFQEGSVYPAICKGIILSINPKVSIIDLTHNINKFDIIEGAFILKSSYLYFPVNTIFLAIVDPEVGSNRSLIIVSAYNRYFVGPDNGIFSFIKEDEIEQIVAIENKSYFSNFPTNTFHGRHILAPVCGFLSLSHNPTNFGPTIKKMQRIPIPEPYFKNKTIIGEIISIDSFGNLITNIEEAFIKSCFTAASLSTLTIKLNDKITIKGIKKTYADAKENTPLALINSFNLLEIAFNKNSAAKILGCKIHSKVAVYQ